MAEPAACRASGCMEALLFVASSSEADLSANFAAASIVRTGGAITVDLFACDFAAFLGSTDGSTNTKSLAAEVLSTVFISLLGTAPVATADLLEVDLFFPTKAVLATDILVAAVVCVLSAAVCSFRTSLLLLPGTSS